VRRFCFCCEETLTQPLQFDEWRWQRQTSWDRLKHFRAVTTRYDKRDDNFLVSVQLASIRIWLRHNESVT
jgi:transposase